MSQSNKTGLFKLKDQILFRNLQPYSHRNLSLPFQDMKFPSR